VEPPPISQRDEDRKDSYQVYPVHLTKVNIGPLAPYRTAYALQPPPDLDSPVRLSYIKPY